MFWLILEQWPLFILITIVIKEVKTAPSKRGRIFHFVGIVSFKWVSGVISGDCICASISFCAVITADRWVNETETNNFREVWAASKGPERKIRCRRTSNSEVQTATWCLAPSVLHLILTSCETGQFSQNTNSYSHIIPSCIYLFVISNTIFKEISIHSINILISGVSVRTKMLKT